MKFEKINKRQYAVWREGYTGCAGYVSRRTNGKWHGHGRRGKYSWAIDEMPTRLMVGVALTKMYDAAT